MKSLLSTTGGYAAAYLASLPERTVVPTAEAIVRLAELDGPLPEHSRASAIVLRQLHIFGAPPLQVVVGEKVHAGLPKALSLLGPGRERVLSVPVDDQGRMRADALPQLDDKTIVCIQAGNVNSGAFEPAAQLAAAGLIERCCRYAGRFAEGLQSAGYEILNDVVLNQVMVSFGDDATTRAVIDGIQREGTCWCGGTVWHGRAAMRISVSSWATTEEDVGQSLAAMIKVAAQI